MDFIDVILSRAKSFTGETATLVQQAQAAMDDANEIVNRLEDIEDRATAASALAEDAADALAVIDTTVDNEVKKLALSLTNNSIVENNTNLGIGYNLITTYPDNTQASIQNIIRLYNSRGTHTDGAMTQNAVNSSFNSIEQELTRIENKIDNKQINLNFSQNDAGKLTVVGQDGSLIPSSLTEQEIITHLTASPVVTPTSTGIIGLEIDYVNKTFTRIEEAEGKTSGNSCNSYSMYGGRLRCNVADNGKILAWYGDNNYTEDGSNGQVMVYQPKFYYKKIPIFTQAGNGEVAVLKEKILISETNQTGFNIYPLFINASNEELDYVLISAYEACAYSNTTGYNLNDSSSVNISNDSLSSIAGAKPISGVNKVFTIEAAENMANNRGANWHITNLAAEAMNQILSSIEYGSLNGQTNIGLGVVNLQELVTYNCSSITGSTSSLGNGTGRALTTRNEINGTYTDYTEDGKTAISYRGYENPWGNIWKMVGGVKAIGDSTKKGGEIYICNGYDYNNSSNYTNTNTIIPNNITWLGAPQYNGNYSWAFIPSDYLGNGNSALPIGDAIWATTNLNGTNSCLFGGAWYSSTYCGPFYYAFDRSISYYRGAQGARIMYIPEKDSNYTYNCQLWRTKMGVG